MSTARLSIYSGPCAGLLATWSAIILLNARALGHPVPVEHSQIIAAALRHPDINPEDVHLVQAPELSYRFHDKYPLGKNGPLEQITGNNVLRRLRNMARDLDFYEHTDFCSEVETIRMEDDRCAQASGFRAAPKL